MEFVPARSRKRKRNSSKEDQLLQQQQQRQKLLQHDSIKQATCSSSSDTSSDIIITKEKKLVEICIQDFFNDGTSSKQRDQRNTTQSTDSDNNAAVADVESENNKSARTYWKAEYVKQFFNFGVSKKIVESFMQSHGLIQAAIESYNHIVMVKIPEIIYDKRELFQESERKLNKVIFYINHVHIEKPTTREDDGTVRTILPNDARVRKLSYSASIYISFTYTEYYRQHTSQPYVLKRRANHSNKLLGKIPVMVRSMFCNLLDNPENDDECSLDPGGYFIVSGTEKAIMMQERVRTNYPFIRENGSNNRYSHTCEIRSIPDGKLRSTSTLYIKISSQRGGCPPSVVVTIPFTQVSIPLYAMFRMLHVDTKEKMMRYILCNDGVVSSIHKRRQPSQPSNTPPPPPTLPQQTPNTRTCSDDRMVYLVSNILNDDTFNTDKMETYEEVIQYISSKGTNQVNQEQRIKTMQHLIGNEFLPHMGTDQSASTYHAKAMYFGYSIWKLILASEGKIPPDNRDDYTSKRIETPGTQIGLLFRQMYMNYLKGISATMHKTLEKGKNLNLVNLLNHRKFTSNLQYPFATGSWSVQKGGCGSTQTGVAQVLSRITQTGMISHLRKVNTPLSRDGKLPEPRQLNHSHWNVCCPAETPEGESCGLMQNIALMTHLRVGFSARIIYELLLNDMFIEYLEIYRKDTHLPYRRGDDELLMFLTETVAIQKGSKYLRKQKHIDAFKLAMMSNNDLVVTEASAASAGYPSWKRYGLVIPITKCTTDDMLTTTSIHSGGRSFSVTRVFVNGSMVGVVRNSEYMTEYVYDQLCESRRSGAIPHDTTIYWKKNSSGGDGDGSGDEIWVTTDSGEPSRPVIVLSKIHKLPEIIGCYAESFPNGMWQALFLSGVLQYLSKEEEKMFRVSPSLRHMYEFPSDKYTHLEVHPCAILGICANMIPFPEHNQAPRNMYEAAMQKQRISCFPSNFIDRFYTLSYTLHYGQKPLVGTMLDKLMHGDEVPSGQNPIVAVTTYGGYNVEDAIMMNKSSIERGLFHADLYRTYRDEESSLSNLDGPKFYRIDPTDRSCAVSGLRSKCYDALDEDGLPSVGAIVKENDALIGKVINTASDGKRDLSVCVKSSENAQVSGVIKTVGKDDRAMVTVQTRARRIPEIGDKFSSHHGQKGVLGMILPQEDMPFTSEGITPDIIMNPHGFPSRMTIAQMIEMILGKAVCVSDRLGGSSSSSSSSEFEDFMKGDGTAFQNDFNWNDREERLECIYQHLKDRGYEPHGKETMYNGMTGEKMDVSIFIAPIQYQRLKHMVQDKMHGRSSGPCSLLTRQPTEGRSRDGGLRMGEMEVNNMVSSGCSEVLVDRLFKQSDAFTIYFCKKCGLLAESRTSVDIDSTAAEAAAAAAELFISKSKINASNNNNQIDSASAATTANSAVLVHQVLQTSNNHHRQNQMLNNHDDPFDTSMNDQHRNSSSSNLFNNNNKFFSVSTDHADHTVTNYTDDATQELSSASSAASSNGSTMSHQFYYYCRNCDEGCDVVAQQIPYATKLLIQELYSLHIGVRLVPNE